MKDRKGGDRKERRMQIDRGRYRRDGRRGRVQTEQGGMEGLTPQDRSCYWSGGKHTLTHSDP